MLVDDTNHPEGFVEDQSCVLLQACPEHRWKSDGPVTQITT
jgi:hypothetical protein